jgi:hypothetical protein
MKQDFTELEPARAYFGGEQFKRLNTEEGERRGCFSFHAQNGVALSCLVDIKHGWEHISVTGKQVIRKLGKDNEVLDESHIEVTPSWEHMKAIKELFFEDEETVFQFHPALSQKAGAHDHTLHLWRPADGTEIPLPPSHLVDYSSDLWKPVPEEEACGDSPGPFDEDQAED